MQLTPFTTTEFLIMGTIAPATVPIPFERPMRMLAYLGAISKWFTLNPDIANPLNATPKIQYLETFAQKWKIVFFLDMPQNEMKITRFCMSGLLRFAHLAS